MTGTISDFVVTGDVTLYAVYRKEAITLNGNYALNGE
jgi:hypothetical protein